MFLLVEREREGERERVTAEDTSHQLEVTSESLHHWSVNISRLSDTIRHLFRSGFELVYDQSGGTLDASSCYSSHITKLVGGRRSAAHFAFRTPTHNTAHSAQL